MSAIRMNGGRCYIPSRSTIKINMKKDDCLEPEPAYPNLIQPPPPIKGTGLSELQQKISSLNFLDDTPIKPILKGERKKRNISFSL